MWNKPTQKQLDRIPRLYETENTPFKEKIIHLHFFLGSNDWFIAEYDGEDIFFGFAILNGDTEMAEWGYASFKELKSIKIYALEVNNDLFWDPVPAKEVPLIREACQWTNTNITNKNR
jgi:hypothetical protein